MTIRFSRVALAGSLLGGAVWLSGCSGSADNGAAPAPGASAPATPAPAASAAAGAPVSVTTAAVRQRDFVVALDAIGTSTPVASVDVKAQTTGVVTQVLVKDGQFVRKGQLLFTLDSRSDDANVAKMSAQVAKDEASLADAKRQLARSRELLAQNFVSQGAVDASQTQVESQAAAVEGDRAALQAAKVSLSFTRVTAPSSGRVGVVTVFPGTAVQANLTTLVTVTQLDPIDVSFSLPQRNLNDVLTALKAGNTLVTARLPESSALLTGKLQFVDNNVDAATGTIKVKARFPNEASKLWPGAFVNVTMNAATLKDAIVVPTASIIQSARGSIVYVADKGKAGLRPVKVLAAQGEDTVVSGVKPGERVVLDGRQNLRPDSPLVDRGGDGKAGTPSRPASGASKPAAS